MADQRSIVKIYRSDPADDAAPRYETYEVPVRPKSTVLEVLNYIYRHCDSSLAYRYACKIGFCVSCLVEVNGKPVYSCMKTAEPEMVIEPHHKYQLIRDLVVDLSEASRRTKRLE